MQAAKNGSETILVVDDEETVRLFVKDVLEQYGYYVIDAPGGKEALAMAGQYSEEIDLLLTDVMMPTMNGNQLSVRLRAKRPNIKVLFVSGCIGELIDERTVLRDGVSFLAKPFTPSALAAKVRDILDDSLSR